MPENESDLPLWTLTRTVILKQQWKHVRAATEEAAIELLENGTIERDPDKEDEYDELIDADLEAGDAKAFVRAPEWFFARPPVEHPASDTPRG